MNRSSVFTIGTTLVIAFALALLLAVGWLGAPQADVSDLMAYLGMSTVLSLVLGLPALLWVRSGRGPLLAKLTLTYALGLLIAAINVVLTAGLMFISLHDRSLLLLLLAFSGLLALGLGVALADVLNANVIRLREGARALTSGDLSARVQVRGGDELAELAADFNRMAEQLAHSEEERRRMEESRRDLIAAISHDLRTPLASLRAMTEALADGVVSDPAMTSRYLNTMRGQISHLSTLIDDLFELAQIDAGALKLHMERALLSDLLSDVLEGLRVEAQHKGVRLEGHIDPRVEPVLMAPQKIERVIYNLVTNAIRHTPPDGSVTISAAIADPASLPSSDHGATRPAVLVSVSDTGEGIDVEDLPHIFDRFYRGEKSRSRATGGAGLGLAIAQGIIEAHGGSIGVESQRGVGTTFRFTLPVAG